MLEEARAAESGGLIRPGGRPMGTEEDRCSYCEEPLDGGPPPPGCPFHGDASCPLAVNAPEELRDPGPASEPAQVASEAGSLSETVAYLGPEGPGEIEGFPEDDDLVESPLGQYRIGPVIGLGSMGRVYRAEHTGLGRPCAIKVMNPALIARQPQILGRFWAEARAVAGLVHPNVVTVHNLGSDRGYHYIEMEYVPGGVSLKQTLVREGPMEPIRATTMVRQVVAALGAAHRAGLVHRDVKPANVLLTAEGHAKLADFGLVRRFAEGERAAAPTPSPAPAPGPADPLAGTPSYMAPELFAGAAAGPGTDLYAVGVMYYYLLSGRLPFSSERLPRLIALHRQAPIPDVRRLASAVSEEMAGILARCLAKEPAIRYADAAELADDLDSALLGLLSPDDLIREALGGISGVVLGGRGHYRALLQLPGGRLQEVYVEATADRLGHRLLSIYSVCCPAEPDHFEFALRLNSELTYGGLSLREVDGRPMFVMTRAYPGGRATPDEVRAAVLEIARRSDWVEQQLTRADIF